MYHTTHCAVEGCKTTKYNKISGISLFQCPKNSELRSKWYQTLRHHCSSLDWLKSRICSRHFEHKYFDEKRNLKENAVPTLFQVNTTVSLTSRTNVDKLLNKMTQAELMADIRNGMSKLKEPTNLTDFVTEDLTVKSETPLEAKLWIMLKKQYHLNTRLMELSEKNKKHVEVLQHSLEETRNTKKALEKNNESYKYIIKSLQEKHATLEEQIEILTAAESR